MRRAHWRAFSFGASKVVAQPLFSLLAPSTEGLALYNAQLQPHADVASRLQLWASAALLVPCWLQLHSKHTAAFFKSSHLLVVSVGSVLLFLLPLHIQLMVLGILQQSGVQLLLGHCVRSCCFTCEPISLFQNITTFCCIAYLLLKTLTRVCWFCAAKSLYQFA